ncbi:MAG: tRNA (uridine(54)-C5)-methyltransferase TrmA [Sulfurospirillaceae bacterium]|nr:tRNA (uridine(54)-C5)-methyltransferase TrmA [Sulfurospirillaceae bacterium]
MTCQYFGICGSCKLYDLSYDEQITQKKEYIKEQFEEFNIGGFEFFTSPQEHYRSRAEFRIWHDGENIDYGMHKLNENGILKIKDCPKVNKKIYDLMPKLLEYLSKYKQLKYKLYAVEFLSSKESILVTLIYHKPLTDAWSEEAKKLESVFDIHVIGRSKKIKKVLSTDFVMEKLNILEKEYRYQILEGGFSQPNTQVNEKMIEWVLKNIQDPKDLLELYCGHGNFTLPLSGRFQKVLATEISKISIKSALENCKLNDISNIEFLRMSVEELTGALKKEREFNRLKDIDLESFDFSHVFVDPPRAGMDEKSLEFIEKFENIIYISCNPITLKRDLNILIKRFEIVKFAVFDQFPYTNHIESGIILRRKQNS